MNRWKLAFFIQLALLIPAVLFLLYHNIDQAVTIDHGHSGRADVEAHRDILNGLLVGKLTKDEIKASKIKVSRSTGDYMNEVTISDLYFNYDSQGRYKASGYGASETVGFKQPY